jgi:hypothetical protein
MQAFIVHGGNDDEALRAASRAGVPAEAVDKAVLPTTRLTAVERVQIYRGMYLLRLTDALEVDYPGVAHFLGDEGFRRLVAGYVDAHPSRSYTLNRLGDQLPDYIRTATGMRRRDFVHDLARLELAVSQVFDGPESEALTPEQIAAVPEDAWGRVRLRTVAAFRLVQFRYPVNAYLDSLKDDQHDHPRARLKETWVAVFRRNYSCYRLELAGAAYELLRALVAGRTLGEAVTESVKKKPGRRRGLGEDELFRWFRQWMSEGVFQSVETE